MTDVIRRISIRDEEESGLGGRPHSSRQTRPLHRSRGTPDPRAREAARPKVPALQHFLHPGSGLDQCVIPRNLSLSRRVTFPPFSAPNDFRNSSCVQRAEHNSFFPLCIYCPERKRERERKRHVKYVQSVYFELSDSRTRPDTGSISLTCVIGSVMPFSRLMNAQLCQEQKFGHFSVQLATAATANA